MKYSLVYLVEQGWPNQPYTILSNDPAEVMLLESDTLLTEADLQEVADHLDSIEYRAQRAAAYPPIEQLVVAMLEKYEEGRSPALDEILRLRQEVKTRYPKPQ